MFPVKHYVPILKGKEGEFLALRKTSSRALSMMTPVIEIMGFTPIVIEEDKLAKRRKPLPTLNSHIKKSIEAVVECWKGNGEVFIDLHYIPIDLLYSIRGGYVNIIFNELYHNGIKAIPVVYSDSDKRIFDDVNNIHVNHNSGVAIRLRTLEMVSSVFLEQTQHKIKAAVNQIDLIIDYHSIIGESIATLVKSAKIFINDILYEPGTWRTLTVASGAFPVDLGDYDPLTQENLDRSDWLFWQQLIKQKLKRMPSFGDYSIAHPDLQTFAKFPNVSASIRYATSDGWRIMRGQGTKKRGWAQIRQRCKDLIVLPEYDGSSFSWGDKFISDCAANTIGTGGAKEWRQIANNRHFEKTTFTLSTLSGI